MPWGMAKIKTFFLKVWEKPTNIGLIKGSILLTDRHLLALVQRLNYVRISWDFVILGIISVFKVRRRVRVKRKWEHQLYVSFLTTKGSFLGSSQLASV